MFRNRTNHNFRQSISFGTKNTTPPILTSRDEKEGRKKNMAGALPHNVKFSIQDEIQRSTVNFCFIDHFIQKIVASIHGYQTINNIFYLETF